MLNIMRFNWPFFTYALTGLMVGTLLLFFLHGWAFFICLCVIFAMLLGLIIPLLVSAWVYDYSDLYTLPWLKEIDPPDTILNLTAGFDEASETLEIRYPRASLKIFDFYDAKKHTEASVQRARRAYPPHPKTQSIQNNELPLADHSCELIHAMFCLHEIRDQEERSAFFKELKRVCKPNGTIIVIEHLRDIPNSLAYSLGSLHFHSSQAWRQNFTDSALILESETKHTPFISIFTLRIQ